MLQCNIEIVINNLLTLKNIEDALDTAWGYLNTVVNVTIGQISGLIITLEAERTLLCDALYPVVDC